MTPQGQAGSGAGPVRTRFDWVLEAVSLLALVVVFGLVMLNWDQIPDAAPRRFGPPGHPTLWTVKNGLWLVMGLNLLTYLVLTMGGMSGRLIQIPGELDRVAPHVRPMMFSMVLVLKTALMLFAVYLTYALVSIAQGRGGFFSGWSLTAFVLVVPLPLALYTVRLRR